MVLPRRALLVIFVCCASLHMMASGQQTRVKRQLQTLLTALKQNPSLVQQLQNNPALLRRLRSQLSQSQQQQPELPQSRSSSPLLSNIQSQQRPEQCSSLRKQNKLLRQMILSVTGGEDINNLDFVSRDQRLLGSASTINDQDTAAVLLEQAVDGPAVPTTSLQSILVTPTATWTTATSTTSYVTTVTHTITSEVPIILRGKRVVTTILEPDTQVVTATEIKTSSVLATPAPTWKTFTVTVTPTPVAQQLPLLLSPTREPIFLPQPISPSSPRKRNNKVVQQAKVIEIEETTSPTTKLDKLKAAYGAFFASSAQRSAQRFGDTLGARPVRHSSSSNNRNPLFSSSKDFDYYEEFDQQGLAAQARPIYAENPRKQQQEDNNKRRQKEKVFTLYFSGRDPGEFSTRLTRLPVDDDGRPILSRNKRDIIQPSKVEPITKTEAPSMNDLDNVMGDSLENQLDVLLDIFSSLELRSSQEPTVTVTKTETITQTLCSN